MDQSEKKDIFIKRIIQQKLGVEIDDYFIQGITHDDDITYIDLSVVLPSYPESIDIRWNISKNVKNK